MEAPTYGGVGAIQLPPGYAHEEGAPLLAKDPTEGKFTAEPRYNDVWATALFVANTTAFIGLNVYSFKAYAANLATPTPVLDDGTFRAAAFAVDHSLLILALSSILLSFALSFGYFVLIQTKTAFLVKFTFIFSVLVTVAMGIFLIMSGSLFWGMVNALVGLLVLSMYKYWAAKMPFAVELLKTVTSVTRKYPATLAVALSGLFVQIAWSAFWIFSLAVNYSVFQQISNCRVEDGQDGKSKIVCDNNKLYMIMVYLNFVMFWNSEVVKNVVHVTISGVFGAYYFFEGSASGTLRYILNSLRSDSDDGLSAFLSMCASCILACLESLFEIFNKFAFTQVAIYGKPFIQAASDTWAMIKDRGVDAIVNDSLVGNVLGMVVILEMILGAVMMSIPNNVLDSGVTTTFVALAEDPEVLHRTKPELYQSIVQHYPEISRNVRGEYVGHH
ncbi:putative choline transporter, neither null mutation nor overexpression affects choline transport [Mortierella alpina]|uniref:Protein PNS1 n=1 Tax=Mortierella alpina TaxID=64518 RepID=A0A9P6LWJ1_MORAP|nr:putative choline transporter, neither null mutation nor overexpression affects choline transport [Mortierella alpina]